MAEGVSVPLVSSRLKSQPRSAASGASMSYAPASDVGSRLLERAGMEVIGRGAGTLARRAAGSTASWTLGAVWWREEEVD